MRYRFILLKLFFVVNFLSIQAYAQLDSKLSAKLDQYFSETQQEWNVPGMSVAIVKNGEIIFSKGYGVKEVGKPEAPDGNTLYAVASNSKAFTASMIAMLAQENKLSIKDKVQQYIPYFEVYDPLVSQQVSIEDLLCHRVGLGTFSGDLIWYRSDFSSEEIIKRIRFVPQSFGFRDGFGYSNLMFITAGQVIKEITGKSWGQNLQERILTPLSMDRTIYSISKLTQKGNFATPHALVNDKNIGIPWDNWEEIGAMGGIISSVNDMAKWMVFNMNQGIINNDTLLTQPSLNLLWQPHNTFMINHFQDSRYQQTFSGYGLGWMLSDINGHLKVSHTGGFDGMISAVTMVPDQQIGVVVLTNGMNSPIRAVVNYTLDALLDLPEKDWSEDLLAYYQEREKKDTRIDDIKNARISNAAPLLELNAYEGKYFSPLVGEINVMQKNNQLYLQFLHAPHLNAILETWHYNVFELKWDNQHTAFSVGTVQFITDNNMEIKGMEFDVPNNDFFFDELSVKRLN